MFDWSGFMPQGFQCRLFGSTLNSIDLEEYGVGELSTQMLPPRIPIKGEVVGTACIASGEPLIVLSSEIEGSTALRPISLGLDTDGLLDGASSSTKRKRTSVKSEMHSQYEANQQFQDHWAAKLRGRN